MRRSDRWSFQGKMDEIVTRTTSTAKITTTKAANMILIEHPNPHHYFRKTSYTHARNNMRKRDERAS